MIPRFFSALALLLSVVAAQAQGVVSPVASPKSTPAVAETPPVEQETPAAPAGFNPFKPPAPVVTPTVDPNAPPPPPPVDPVVAAIAEELQAIREKGERLGKINGQTIFRYEGRYLIEAATAEESPEGVLLDSAKRQAVLAGECVIQVVTDASKREVRAKASQPAQNNTR